MKKVKLIIALLMCLVSSISFGQSFSITPTGLMNSEILTDDFVIINIENNKSSSEIYNNLMSYITTTYVNGNKNADSKTIENEYIRFNTYIPKVSKLNGGLGIMWDLYYSTEIFIKDGKIKIKMSIIDIKQDTYNDMYKKYISMIYIGNGTTWSFFDKNLKLKNSSKQIKSDIEYKINENLNNIIKSIYNKTTSW